MFEAEPPTGSPLLDAPNTLLTPHLGASTAEAQVAVAEEVAEQVIDVLDGRPARYAVNAPLLTPETAQAIAPYLPLAETLGRFLAPVRARGAVGRSRSRSRASLAAYDASPLVAAVAARAARDRDDGAREPRQRGARSRRRAGSTSSSARPPTPARSRSLLTVTAEADGARRRRSRAPSPAASCGSCGSTSYRAGHGRRRT